VIAERALRDAGAPLLIWGVATMIRVVLYNNGFRIQGHSNPRICGEVCIVAWFCVCSIERADKTCWAYLARTDAKKYGRDPNEGLSELVFDTENPRAAFGYEEFQRNIEAWAAGDQHETDWPHGEVSVERLLENLEPTFSTSDRK
jgi:hypothetical protein